MSSDVTAFQGIMDFVPVTVMFIGILTFRKAISLHIRKNNSTLILISAIIILLSSGSKATHKTIIGLSGPDIEILYRIFWVGMTAGYIMLFVTLLVIESDFKRKKADIPLAATMPLKPVFMLAETVGLFGTYIMMLRFSAKLRNKSGVVCFAISLALIPVQLYLGSIFNDVSVFHWIAQSVNFLSALFFTLGVFRIKGDIPKLSEAFSK